MSNLAALFTPIVVGDLTLPHRVFMSSMTRNRSSPTNVPNYLNAEYYRQRAKGGASLIISEGILVSQQGTTWPNAPGIWSQEHIQGWKQVTDAVHEEGSKIFAQLWHVGRLSHPDAPEQIAAGTPVYAPSAISARGGKFHFIAGQPGYVTPTPIDDPWRLVASFKQAALNAKEAGFDGIEIHGANGYLVHQFLDYTTNTRTDQWGGSVENRSRFGLEVIKAAISVWGAGCVGLKVSPSGGYNDIGMPLQDTQETFNHFLSEADNLGTAYVTLARHGFYTDPVIDGKKRATPHDVITTYKPILKKALVFGNHDFTGEEAAQYIKEGKMDGVFFGSKWIAHPDLALRFEHGKPLGNNIDYVHLYGDGGDLEAQRKGYTDYPTLTSYD